MTVASGATALTYALEKDKDPGDHINSRRQYLRRHLQPYVNNLSARGIEHTMVNLNDTEALRNAIKPNTKVVYGETFGNPNSDVTDLDAIAEIAHANGALFFVDNTFGTPYIIRPIEHGADIVIHSATKFIGGHGSTLGGVIVDGGNFDYFSFPGRFPTLTEPDPNYHGAVFAEVSPKAAFVDRVRAVVLRDEGACISPFNAFLLLLDLETLSLRVERHVTNEYNTRRK